MDPFNTPNRRPEAKCESPPRKTRKGYRPLNLRVSTTAKPVALNLADEGTSPELVTRTKKGAAKSDPEPRPIDHTVRILKAAAKHAENVVPPTPSSPSSSSSSSESSTDHKDEDDHDASDPVIVEDKAAKKKRTADELGYILDRALEDRVQAAKYRRLDIVNELIGRARDDWNALVSHSVQKVENDASYARYNAYRFEAELQCDAIKILHYFNVDKLKEDGYHLELIVANGRDFVVASKMTLQQLRDAIHDSGVPDTHGILQTLNYAGAYTGEDVSKID